MLDKVRKLLAKAEDSACSPAEAEALTAKATELIAKYGVDQALLAARDPARDPVVDRMIEVPAPYATDKAGLLVGVAIPLRCRTVRLSRAGSIAVHLFGFDSDVTRAELLYTSLLVQAAHGLAATAVPWGQHPAAFRRSWLAGFAAAIAARLRATESAASSAVPSMDLVLADRSGVVERRRDEAYPTARLARPRRLSGDGGASGYAAGTTADLGGGSHVGTRTRDALP
ncbi:hypothetical protein Ais01nite_76930 [Asanoa ishikariensis]|uniref:DUF2786 domain-containing protein n=1 Tax=Asanoa ishikariensis TaxID=137265 RepID=UPI001A537AE2|nr:DUF2786 domain-containing protein [Asanoa ishikariensis]GIF69658.1 hypothetical protein Ais01nite_76930 [Asanoa ishikariensis]